MTYEIAGVKHKPEEFLGSIDQSIAALESSEAVVIDTFALWLSTRNGETQHDLQSARTDSEQAFGRVVNDVLSEPKVFFDHEVQLRTIYKEVTDRRIEHLMERFPFVDEMELKRHCVLGLQVRTILKHFNARHRVIQTLNNNYNFELNKNLMHVTNIDDDNPPISEEINEVMPDISTVYDFSLYKKAAVLGAASLILVGGYAVGSKFKNRLVKGT